MTLPASWSTGVAQARGARRVVLGLVIGAGLVLAAAVPAEAHASLEKMTPAASSIVTTAPSRVTLFFDENVRAPSKVVVTGPAGRVDDGPTRVLDNTVSVAVTMRARPADVGAYRVAYRVVSADGHVVSAEESFRFAPPGVQAAPQSSRAAATATGSSSHLWWWVAGVTLVVLAAVALLVPRRGSGRGRRR